jgi:myosin heavy subunit
MAERPPSSAPRKNSGLDVEDLVFLSDLSIKGIAKNLQERFMKDEIYTSIGPVVISCNPFKVR